jgi:hypothetical protein
LIVAIVPLRFNIHQYILHVVGGGKVMEDREFPLDRLRSGFYGHFLVRAGGDGRVS